MENCGDGYYNEMKHLDSFFNYDDFLELYEYVSSLTDNLYVQRGNVILNATQDLATVDSILICSAQPISVPFVVKDIAFLDQLDAVFIEKPTFTDYGFYHPGGIVCKTDSPEALTLYNKISIYIKKNYHKSNVTQYYFGPNMYQQWKEHKVEYHFFVDAKSFTINEAAFDVQAVIARFKELGYLIKENWHDIRLPENDLAGNEFMIFAPDAKLHSRLISRRMFFFPDSDAVFFLKEEKKHQWRFLVDARHFDTMDDSAVQRIWDHCLELQ